MDHLMKVSRVDPQFPVQMIEQIRPAAFFEPENANLRAAQDGNVELREAALEGERGQETSASSAEDDNGSDHRRITNEADAGSSMPYGNSNPCGNVSIHAAV